MSSSAKLEDNLNLDFQTLVQLYSVVGQMQSEDINRRMTDPLTYTHIQSAVALDPRFALTSPLGSLWGYAFSFDPCLRGCQSWLTVCGVWGGFGWFRVSCRQALPVSRLA